MMDGWMDGFLLSSKDACNTFIKSLQTFCIDFQIDFCLCLWVLSVVLFYDGILPTRVSPFAG